MPDKTPAPATAIAATPPIGTPPAGGRWTWSGSEWVQIPEPDAPAAASAADAPNTPPQE